MQINIFYLRTLVFSLACMVVGVSAVSAPVYADAPKKKQSVAKRAADTNAQPIDIVINKAERQVMLSQRAAKLYAQGALGVMPARSQAMMEDTVQQFESELAWLRANAPSPILMEGLTAQNKAWIELKVYLSKPPVREHIDEVGELSENLYAKTRATALAVEALTVNPTDEIVGQSGKQRVLIQRLGKLYMFERAGFKNARTAFETTRQEFLNGHAVLGKAKETNATIKRELDLVLGQAQLLFVSFVDNKAGVANNDAFVGKSIEVMMQMQDAITTLFEQL